MRRNMLIYLSFLFCVLIGMGIADTATAETVLFNDNFNSENGGIGWAGNYTGFSNWTVTTGSVDLIGFGSWDFLNRHGDISVDLDGSTNAAGTIVSKQTFLLTPGTVLLQFDLAGSQRGSDEGYRNNFVNVKLGTMYDEIFTLKWDDPLTTYSRYINITTATNAYLSFQNMYDGTYYGDNIGALLDNVKLTASVFEPTTLLLLGFGLIGLAGMRRKLNK
jgi:hypothetical protein